MPLPEPQYIKTPRSPFTKPGPGTGINWRHPFAKHLQLSYPFNEGQGIYVKNYAHSQGIYRGHDLGANLGASSTLPEWGTYDKVPGLHQGFASSYKILGHAVNTGTTNPSTTGHQILPPFDWTLGLTIHVWMKPVAISSNIHFITIGSQATAGAGHTVAVVWAEPFFGIARPKVNVYSDGTSSTTLTGVQMWASADLFPYEHVITITPFGNVRWYTSDGDDMSLGSIAHGITPVANSHFWPCIGTGEGGLAANWDGNIWGVNVYNRVMGAKSCYELMTDPLQMYSPEASNGQVFALIEANPPGDPGPGEDGGGLSGEVEICTQL